MNGTNNILTADKINDHLKSGGVVQVTTYMRSTLYAAKHAGWFSADSKGSIYVRHGKGKNQLTIGDRPLVSIRLGRYK